MIEHREGRDYKFIAPIYLNGLSEDEVKKYLDQAEEDKIFMLRRYLIALDQCEILKKRWFRKSLVRLEKYAAKRGLFMGLK